MTSPLHKAITGASMTRALGPRWLARRVVYGVRQRNGSLQRDLPLTQWDAVPLISELADVALSEPPTYLKYRRERAPSFFFDPETRTSTRGKFASWDEWQSPVAEADAALDSHMRF